MGKSKPLSDIRILLAESDMHLGPMLHQVLQRMGFKSVQLVRDGVAAAEALSHEAKDILITEWQLQSMDGIQLTQQIRRESAGMKRLLPIIMMTARAERQDVEVARDAGITEFVVKPYNSNTIFKRIQQVVDNPRGFLLAPQYVGPDRRRRFSTVGEERRRMMPKVLESPPAQQVPDVPQLILPDYQLKQKLGEAESLDKIITPQVLAEAQQVIESLRDESLHWIRDEVQELNQLYRQMVQSGDENVKERMGDVLLSLKSHAGTFGYQNTSQLAQQLYQFVRFDLMTGSSKHNHVLLKHIQSITVMLRHHAEGKAMDKENWLMQALTQLVVRFRQERPQA